MGRHQKQVNTVARVDVTTVMKAKKHLSQAKGVSSAAKAPGAANCSELNSSSETSMEELSEIQPEQTEQLRGGEDSLHAAEGLYEAMKGLPGEPALGCSKP